MSEKDSRPPQALRHERGDGRLPRLARYMVDTEYTFDVLADQLHTSQLHDEVTQHGLTVALGPIFNAPNDANFQRRYEITDAEMEAIGFYRGSGAADFNRYMRRETRSVPGEQHLATLLELFGEDGKLPRTHGGEVVYRGVPGQMTEVDPAFLSATVRARTGIDCASEAKRHNGTGFVMRLVLPAGIRYLPAGGAEQEVILQPGLRTRQLTVHGPESVEYVAFALSANLSYEASPIDGMIDAVVPPLTRPEL